MGHATGARHAEHAAGDRAVWNRGIGLVHLEYSAESSARLKQAEGQNA